jgi:hypothetical protein
MHSDEPAELPQRIQTGFIGVINETSPDSEVARGYNLYVQSFQFILGQMSNSMFELVHVPLNVPAEMCRCFRFHSPGVTE